MTSGLYTTRQQVSIDYEPSTETIMEIYAHYYIQARLSPPCDDRYLATCAFIARVIHDTHTKSISYIMYVFNQHILSIPLEHVVERDLINEVLYALGRIKKG